LVGADAFGAFAQGLTVPFVDGENGPVGVGLHVFELVPIKL